MGHGTPGASNSVVTTTEENEGTAVPREFSLFQNYPNPFNPTTQINYSVPRRSYITLKVYNLLGQEVATLFEGLQQAGNYKAILDGGNLASGTYLYRLNAGTFVETRKLVLLR